MSADALPRRALLGGLAGLGGLSLAGCSDDGPPGYGSAQGEAFDRLRAEGFRDWRLSVEGLVARPRRFSLADLKALPRRTQITKHSCEEGWSAIAEWSGVPLASVLRAAGVLPSARYVTFYAY